jgi:hypothetical protein
MDADAAVPTPEEFYRALDIINCVLQFYAESYLRLRAHRPVPARKVLEHVTEALFVVAGKREEHRTLLKVLTWLEAKEVDQGPKDPQLEDELKGIIERSFPKDGKP